MTAGRLVVADRVVEKIAQRAVGEVAGATSTPGSVLRRARGTASSATVDGDLVLLSLDVAVTWPLPVRRVVADVRAHVQDRVGTLTGLQVAQVDVRVAALPVAAAARRRVR